MIVTMPDVHDCFDGPYYPTFMFVGVTIPVRMPMIVGMAIVMVV